MAGKVLLSKEPIADNSDLAGFLGVRGFLGARYKRTEYARDRALLQVLRAGMLGASLVGSS